MTSDQTIPVNTLYSSVSATPALSNLVNQSQGSSDPVWDAIQNHINQNQQPAQGMTAKDVGKVISALPDNHPAIQQLSNSITPQQNPHPYLSMLQGLSGALGAYANAQTPSTGAALIAGAHAFTPAMQAASRQCHTGY